MFRDFMPSMGTKDNTELLKLAREIDPPKRTVEMNNEIETDKEVVYEEEFDLINHSLNFSSMPNNSNKS